MRRFLHHLFIPHYLNGYRAKLLHNKVLLLVIAFLFFGAFLLGSIKVNFPSVLGISSDITSDQLLLFTNQKRQENGLPPLELNPELSAAASGKVNDMFSKDYWAHISPDGKTPWVFIRNAGYNYVYAGENLARGFTNTQDIINAWMASSDHRANVLSANYRDVGFAVATGKLNGEEIVLVAEMLGSRTLGPVARKVENQRRVATATTSAPVARTVLQAQGKVIKQPIINSAVLSSILAKGIISLFIFSLILDMIIAQRRKIVRFVGHNTDHILFLGLMLLLIVAFGRGAII